MKKIIISVTSDLVTDQRVHKVSQSLHRAGYNVLLFGRKKRSSKPIIVREYQVKRTRLIFEKGFLFYANYNIRLFFYLLFNKADILISNDLDTLWPNYLISKFFKTKLVYDTHEYFTGVPELLERPFVRGLWKKLENGIFPKLPIIYTVNDSIADIYEKEYKVNLKVIKNLPLPILENDIKIEDCQLDEYWNIPPLGYDMYFVHKMIYEQLKRDNRKVIIYQGAINKDRGIEEMMAAMEFIDNAVLLIIGIGDLFKKLQKKLEGLPFKEKIMMINQVPFERLAEFTGIATIGVSLEKPTNINYVYSSPNKVVDYILSRVPVLATRLIEIEKIVSKYQVGAFIENHEPMHIAEKINAILKDENLLNTWKLNCVSASKELTWLSEEKKLLEIIETLDVRL